MRSRWHFVTGCPLFSITWSPGCRRLTSPLVTAWRKPWRRNSNPRTSESSTPENVGAPWVLFEAGALAKSMQGARVIPLLFNLGIGDITGPLAQFQAKKVEKGGLGDAI